MIMKKYIFLALSFVLFSTTTFAQNNRGQRQRMDPTEMYNRMAERLVKQMKLDDEKGGLFTVLYLDYQMARQNAANPKGEKEEEEVDMKKLTDEKALELINKQIAAQEAQAAVDKEYLPKFLEILTPVQASQVFLRRQGMRDGQRQGSFNGPRGGGFPNGGFGGGFGGGFPGGNM